MPYARSDTPPETPPTHTQGFALITVLIMMSVMAAILGSYFFLTLSNLSSASSQINSNTGFYSAEAGLNIRAEELAGKFTLNEFPSGVGPTTAKPCQDGDNGSGDLACGSKQLNGRTVTTYVQEVLVPKNPTQEKITNGEFAGLTANAFRYDLYSNAVNKSVNTPADEAGQTEAVLGMRFKSRVIPLFQFLAYYKGDMELFPGPTMNLSGPMHTNGSMYLASGKGAGNQPSELNISGAVTAAGGVHHGGKGTVDCVGKVSVADGNKTLQGLPNKPSGCTSPAPLSTEDEIPFGGRINGKAQTLETPALTAFKPDPEVADSKSYWSKADVRIVLVPDAQLPFPKIQVRNKNNDVEFGLSAGLNGCKTKSEPPQDIVRRFTPDATPTGGFWDAREQKYMETLDIDVKGLIDCIQQYAGTTGVPKLDDTTDGGLVWHFSVDGPDTDKKINNYAVRLRSGKDLTATDTNAPAIKGLTVVSDQKLYTVGDFNSPAIPGRKKPASLMGDTISVLSNDWKDAKSKDPLSQRVAANTAVNAAFVAGTRDSDSVTGENSGGLHNYPRFLEDWKGGGREFKYRGSFVSLGEPQHTESKWSTAYYSPPKRSWDFDTDFEDVRNLPPMTPVVTYLTQEQFTRDFDR